MLTGLRVLDFTWVLAGPYATRLLADFGAEVIKVQSKKTSRGVESNLSAYFSTWNRNKRSITLDMDHPEAREIILRLAGLSDVVIENFAPRVMANWELSYEDLKQVNPGIIMASISAMGQTGPWKDFVAFGPTLQALSGLSYLTAFEPDLPLGVGYAYADHIIGLYAAFAVLAALENRDRTGQGRYIDLSGYEAACTLIGPALLDAALGGQSAPSANSSDWTLAAPEGCYRCAGGDRWCVIAVFDEHQWQALCRVSGHLYWMEDARFSTLLKRKEHGAELERLLEQWTIRYAPEEVVRLLQEAGVPAGVIQSAADLAEDPHLRARDFFVSLDHPVLGHQTSERSALPLKAYESAGWKAAPLLGEGNQHVFQELLGFTDDQLSDLLDRGIIA